MNAAKPLDGITVVDLTHLLAGPFCTMLLADAGATVLKVEPPGGEISRHRLPFLTTKSGAKVSAYFAAVNRGKQSVAIDLKSPLGRRALDELFERADVIAMNYRESALRRLEIEPERLHRRFPQAVVASITAFGRAPGGREADRPGLAIVAEAVSGITSLSRGDESSPTWVGFALGDFVAGQTAFGAVAAALVRAAKSGAGCCLDLSMVDALVAFNGIDLVREQAQSTGAASRMSPVPYGVFPAHDGHVVIGCNSDEFWRRLCVAMDPPGHDPALAGLDTAAMRIRRRTEVVEFVSNWTSHLSRDQVLTRLVEVGVPCGPVNSAADVLRFEHLHRRGSLGPVRVAGTEITLPRGSLGAGLQAVGQTPALPALGEHTEQVLRNRTTLTEAEIKELTRV